MSAELYFIDTNIFVYSFDRSQPRKQELAQNLLAQALSDGRACISYQVMQEFLNVATRKFAQPLSASDAQTYLRVVMEPLCQVYASAALFHHALDIAARWKYSFYDSLIVAAASAANCTQLYSEDLQHGQVLDGLTIVNPFLEMNL